MEQTESALVPVPTQSETSDIKTPTEPEINLPQTPKGVTPTVSEIFGNSTSEDSSTDAPKIIANISSTQSNLPNLQSNIF